MGSPGLEQREARGSRQSQLHGYRAPQARSCRAASQSGPRRDFRASRGAISRRRQGLGRYGSSPARADCRRRAARPARLTRRGRLCALDRMRECCQSGACQNSRAKERNRDPHVAGCQPCRGAATDPGGDAASLARWRRARAFPGALLHYIDSEIPRRPAPKFHGNHARCASVGLHCVSGAPRGNPRGSLTGGAIHENRCQRSPETRPKPRQFGFRRKQNARLAGGLGGCLVAGTADRRRPDDPEFVAAQQRSARLRSQ